LQAVDSTDVEIRARTAHGQPATKEGQMPNRRSKLLFAVAAAIVLLLLAGIAAALASSQSNERSDLEEGFATRPEVSAALTSSLFSATTTTPQQQRQLTNRYGGPAPPASEVLTRQAREGNSVFVALLDDEGKLIASSAGSPPGLKAELRQMPEYVRVVLDGEQPIALSDFLDLGPDAESVQVFAQPVSGAERRILVTGFPPAILAAFLGQTLAQVVDITGGHAYILDSTGAVVASSDAVTPPGEPVPVEGLAESVASAGSGQVGADAYFAAAPIENSTWRVVSIAPEDDVFATTQGWDRWGPWVIFAGLALAAALAFALLWRVFRGADQLAEAHERLDASNRALRQRARELERSNAELDQFASIASHDLQEPLRKVQTFSQRVVDTEADHLSDKGREYLGRSTQAAGRMQRLIEDLLKFSRVGTPEKAFDEIALEQVVHEAASDLEGSLEAAGGSIEVGELPAVLGDHSQIRQLFQNLISNAVKFRREGVPPLVRVEGRERGGVAEIRVHDNGIGFDPRYADRIFRVFERLHGRGEYEGTGIGLALCRKIAERHGGAIAAESTPGEGSTFIVTLPMREEPRRPVVPAESRHPETAGV
jgi:signal transduction histidine kinase